MFIRIFLTKKRENRLPPLQSSNCFMLNARRAGGGRGRAAWPWPAYGWWHRLQLKRGLGDGIELRCPYENSDIGFGFGSTASAFYSKNTMYNYHGPTSRTNVIPATQVHIHSSAASLDRRHKMVDDLCVSRRWWWELRAISHGPWRSVSPVSDARTAHY